MFTAELPVKNSRVDILRPSNIGEVAKLNDLLEVQGLKARGVVVRKPDDPIVIEVALPMIQKVFNVYYSHEGQGIGIVREVAETVLNNPEYEAAHQRVGEVLDQYPNPDFFDHGLAINGDKYDSHAFYILIEENERPIATLRLILNNGCGGDIDICDLMDHQIPSGQSVASEGRLAFHPEMSEEDSIRNVLLINKAGLLIAEYFGAEVNVVLAKHVHRFLKNAGVKLERIEAQPRYDNLEMVELGLCYPEYWFPEKGDPPSLYRVTG